MIIVQFAVKNWSISIVLWMNGGLMVFYAAIAI